MDCLSDLDAVRFESPDDVRGAAIALRDHANGRFPCRVAACHNIAVTQPMVDGDGAVLASEVFGWTEQDRWWRVPQLALASPLPTACRYESEPFWANEAGFRTKRPNQWLDQIAVDRFERRTYVRAAIVVPVHLPFGHIGAVSFSSIDPDVDDLAAQYDQHADLLAAYAHAFIASYQRVMVERERLPVGGTILSKREVECLRWAAIGKTDYEISLIMSRSRATVRFHIHNAATKLDSVNRSQAVFKAAQLGYIGLKN